MEVLFEEDLHLLQREDVEQEDPQLLELVYQPEVDPFELDSFDLLLQGFREVVPIL